VGGNSNKMNKIKFSHHYNKFPQGLKSGSKVKLLQVFKVHYDNLSWFFKRYDTEYTYLSKEYHCVERAYYELPQTKLLVLLFWCPLGVFTTIRRWDERKEEYYYDSIGKDFILEIK